MKQTGTETISYLLEKPRLFSESLLWDVQRRYFSEKGVEAWRLGEVPHYITSNPTAANSYAEIVFAFLCEQPLSSSVNADPDEPLYVCELGAGSGRFAFHFLRRLTRLCELSNLPPRRFRYLLTDFAQSNLDFWRTHPSFQPFFESGVLDFALFDINLTDRLALQMSGLTISAASLRRPLVVVANYVFDSIPQELFYLDADGRSHQCLVSLTIDEEPRTLDAAELLEHLQCNYEYCAPSEPTHQEPYLEQLLAAYQSALPGTHLLFPAAGLRCLERLKSLTTQGLLLLSTDKGEHLLSALHGKPPPALVRHGSFSLSVNYHAFKAFCEQSGGLALFPNHRHRSISVGCLLMLDDAASYTQTRRAYERHVKEFSPDDFYTIAAHARRHIAEMSVADVLAYLRLGYYDSHQFAHYLPLLMELAPALEKSEREAVTDAVEKVWELYFPLGETLDLAFNIACLLYEMDDYDRALTYFKRSIDVYGPHTGTLYNMAACYQLLGQALRAEPLLRTVLEYDPDNLHAEELLTGREL